MAFISITNENGDTVEEFEAAPGVNLMRLFVEGGVGGIGGDCSGCMACGTCVVRVSSSQEADLPPASEDERSALDALCGRSADEGYRLSCQIDIPGGLDRLTVIVPSDINAF